MSDREEYIERGALLRDISETVLFSVKGGTETPTPEMRGARKVIGRIEAVPTADVVEVVRCKDCERITPVEGGLPLCTLHNTAVAYNDFCSYGERKDGADSD